MLIWLDLVRITPKLVHQATGGHQGAKYALVIAVKVCGWESASDQQFPEISCLNVLQGPGGRKATVPTAPGSQVSQNEQIVVCVQSRSVCRCWKF